MSWGGWWRCGGITAVVAWALSFCGPAGAVLKFSASRTLTPPGLIAFVPQVAYDSHDQATLSWTINPDNPSCGTCRRVQTTQLPSSGPAGATHTLSPASEDVVDSPSQLALDSQGRATVVWEAQVGTGYRIQAVRIAADGTPGPLQTLSPAGADAFFPKIAIDSQDRATVVWYQMAMAGPFEVEAMQIGANGALGTPHTLSPPGPGDAVDPSIAIDSADRVTVVWTQWDGTQYRASQVRLDSSGAPGTVHTLSAPGGNVSLPQVAVDSQGRARVVWQWDTSAFGGLGNTMQTALLDASEVEGPVRVLDSSVPEPTDEEVAIGPADVARPVWIGDSSIVTRTVGPTNSLSAAQPLFPPGHLIGDPQIAFDSQGRAIIAFYADDGANKRVRVVRVAADGTLGPVQTLSVAGSDSDSPELAIDSHDRVTVVWDRYDYQHILRVEIARGQAAAPDTKITRGPRGGSAVVSHLVRFSFAAVPGASAGFLECSLDGRAFTHCTSPLRLNGVRDGHHALRVRAGDADGVDATPAVRRFVEIGSCYAKARKSGHLAGARARCRRKVG